MKVTIHIDGSDQDYTVKTETSEPLNDETRMVLSEAVNALVKVTSHIHETADKLKHMKMKRDAMKESNKSARECLDELSVSTPVWVSRSWPGGGEAHTGAGNIEAAKEKTGAQAKERAEAISDIPF